MARGISCLLVDGPGQGATLRREHVLTRFDWEVPVARCIDYLWTRGDVDRQRIAVSGTSLGGYYAARAAACEPRLAAAISHGAIWSVEALWGDKDERYGLAEHIKWVFGAKSMKEALAKAADFSLSGVIERVRCPYLIVHGGHDMLGVEQATRVFDAAIAGGVQATIKILSEDETGAEHCQHDNPTLGHELMLDWLTDQFGGSGQATTGGRHA
jgi:dipeptidyl aminopeptidase/acylaminoacyl peptidase